MWTTGADVNNERSMSNLFSKSLDDVTFADIEALQDTPEGQLFEIKQDLPSEKGAGPDPWHAAPAGGKPRKGPGDYAKQNLFGELVAFANAEGGWLVLGIEEAGDHPKRAGEVKSVPECHALAERLERATQDWIDPPIPGMRFKGIETAANDAAGVVVCRVLRSPIAPHRLDKKGRTQHAYRRVNEESKPMKMREIQDLTLDRARGQERIEAQFERIRERYTGLQPGRIDSWQTVGFQIVLLPTSDPLAIDRPYLHDQLFERTMSLSAHFAAGGGFWPKALDADGMSRSSTPVQPILRGGQRSWGNVWSKARIVSDRETLQEDLCRVEVMESGAVNLVVKTTDSVGLSVHWILVDLANALRIADSARTIGGSPEAEYALEIELRCDERATGGGSLRSTKTYGFGLLGEETRMSQNLGPGPLLLPRYPVRAKDGFSQVIKRVLDDLHNAVQRPHRDDVVGFDVFPEAPSS